MDPEKLRSLLPWRHPFVTIDRVLECVPHSHIIAAKTLIGDDMIALAHRPGFAVFPGVMLLEGLSQSAAVLFQISYGKIPPTRIPLLGHLKATFSGGAAPGEEVAYDVRAVKMTSTRGLFHGTARVAGEAVAEAELAFAVAAPGSAPEPHTGRDSSGTDGTTPPGRDER